jgi:hypothetical protein
MQHVRALVDADWLEIPIKIERPADADPHAPEPPKLVRTLVEVRENGVWKLNHPHYGVVVHPGLVVSFDDVNDANHFLASPDRAVRLHVSPGQVVQFHDEADADHFIALGQAERVNRKEAQKALAQTEHPTAGAPKKVVAMDHKRAGASR